VLSITTSEEVEVEFREIAGETYCLVGSDGGVWTRWRRLGPGYRRETRYIGNEWEELKTIPDYGYRLVHLPSGRRARVHWLVLEAFVGSRPEGYDGLHKNDKRSDNALTNLYWGTPQQNALDRTRNGHAGRNKGTVNGMALESTIVIRIKRLIVEGLTQRAISRDTGVSRDTIRKIQRQEAYADVT
jgi:hypothetical protein